MQTRHVHPRAIVVWRMRLTLAALVPSFCSALFFPVRNWIWTAFTALWAGVYLFLFVVYYPIKYKKLTFALDDRYLVIRCGVFYNRVKAIPLGNLQYMTLLAGPLQRLFRVCSVQFICAGGRVLLPCVGQADAHTLAQLVEGRTAPGEEASSS